MVSKEAREALGAALFPERPTPRRCVMRYDPRRPRDEPRRVLRDGGLWLLRLGRVRADRVAARGGDRRGTRAAAQRASGRTHRCGRPMKPRTRRLGWIVGGLAVLAVAATLVLNAFRSNLVFFFTPTQIAAHEAPQGRPLRIGGLVEAGSLARKARCRLPAPRSANRD